MRFLLFNIVVVVALVHLFSGEGGDVGATLEKTYQKVRSAAADIAQPETPPAPDPRTDTEPPPKAPPKQIAEAAKAAPAAPAPPPLPEPVQVEKPAVHEAPVPDPAVAQRRDEVLWGTVAPDLAPDAFPDAFSEPDPASEAHDRRQALLSLAEEMELFSLRQLNP